jgi:hypothetical protein
MGPEGDRLGGRIGGTVGPPIRDRGVGCRKLVVVSSDFMFDRLN